MNSTVQRLSGRQGGFAGACVAALLLAACGGGGDPAASGQAQTQGQASAAEAGVQPARLRIDGANLLGPDGKAIRLRGANVQGVTADDVDKLIGQFGMNMVRLRISFTPDNRDDSTVSGFKKTYEDAIDSWVQAASGRGLWMVLEMRANDNVANDPAFYDVTKTGPCKDGKAPERCPNFGYYLRAWQYLAARYKDTGYVAGYGLLAEPSPDKTGAADPQATLIAFQQALMSAIDAIDTRTPFFVGPAYNYDTMEYADRRYYTGLAGQWPNRVVYEVNFLMPKEWVQNGQVGDQQPTWPLAEPADGYDSLLAGGKPGEPMEKVFNQQRVLPENYPKTLSKGFIAWYLQWPIQFRKDHPVPLYVDQFGASSFAHGQREYEGELIRYFEQQGLHWSRWSYNAYNDDSTDSQSRTLLDQYPENGPVIRFYTELARLW